MLITSRLMGTGKMGAKERKATNRGMLGGPLGYAESERRSGSLLYIRRRLAKYSACAFVLLQMRVCV